MNDLEKYFYANPGRLIHKCVHYFQFYDRYFSRYRNKPIVVLEIGVSHGGSLQMWKNYFGNQAKIYGIDIDPNCKSFEEDGIEILIGSQSDRAFLADVRRRIPLVDILIDDGSHKMTHQINTFEMLFEHVKRDGIYLCEDLHSSYWLQYGGGHKRRGTFVEYAKNFIDRLNAPYSKQSSLKITPFTNSVKGVHFHNGMVFVEKGEVGNLDGHLTGRPDPRISNRERRPLIWYRVAYPFLYAVNYILRILRLPGIIWR